MVYFKTKFKGGIFLATGFIHLLAESQEGLKMYSAEYPIAFLCSALGFLLTFFFEKVVFFNHHDHHHSSQESDLSTISLTSNHRKSEYGTLAHEKTVSSTPEIDSSKTKETHLVHSTSNKDEDELRQSDIQSNSESSTIAKYLLLIVLSTHSLISGLAMGANNKVDTVQVIGIAILSHKWIESFAVGVSLIRFSLVKWKFILFMFIYAFMEPLGIVIGFVAMSFADDNVSAIFESMAGAIASGTFIYVASIDILSDEFKSGIDRWSKTLSTILGFVFLAILPLFLHQEQ